MRFINTHFAEPVRLEELAEQFEISPAYLSRMFKEITGFSLVEYVNLVRVQEAQRLLATTRLKVIVIAEQVGFGSLVPIRTCISSNDENDAVALSAVGSLEMRKRRRNLPSFPFNYLLMVKIKSLLNQCLIFCEQKKRKSPCVSSYDLYFILFTRIIMLL